MAKVQGVVEVIMPNKFDANKMAMKIEGDDTWYNQKKEFMDVIPNRGDAVEFDSGKTGKYIQYLKVVGGGSAPAANNSSSGPAPRSVQSSPAGRTFPVGKSAPERTINRQNALTAAVQYGIKNDLSPEQCIDIARLFEAYTTGDSDKTQDELARAELGIE